MPLSRRLRKFQFHKGTIKTRMDSYLNIASENFNSIKVRLKPGKREIPATLTEFQFHKGTIKTAAPIRNAL